MSDETDYMNEQIRRARLRGRGVTRTEDTEVEEPEPTSGSGYDAGARTPPPPPPPSMNTIIRRSLAKRREGIYDPEPFDAA